MSLRSCCSLSSHSELLSLLPSSGDLLLPEEMTEDADDSCCCCGGGSGVVVVVVGAAAVEENCAAFPCGGGASVAQLRSLREVAAEKLRGVPSVAKVLSVSAAQSSSAWLWLWLWLRGGADCWRCVVCP